MFAAFALIPRFVQAPESTGYGFGDSVTTAGLILLPSALIQLAVGPLAGRLGMRLGFRVTLMIGALLSVVSYVMLALFHETRSSCSSPGSSSAPASRSASPRWRTSSSTRCRSPTSASRPASTRSCAPRAARSARRRSTAILAGSIAEDTGLPTEGAYTAAFVSAVVVGLLALGAAWLVPRGRRRAWRPPFRRPPRQATEGR